MRRTTVIDPGLAASLATRRRASRVTQNALALELGVSEGMISKWETCRVPVPPSLAARIEAALAQIAQKRGRVVALKTPQ